jgi:thiosulfate reductase cytochrome b subunit
MNGGRIMKDATKRSIVRCIHIVFSIPILGYIYSPFEQLPTYAPRVRFVVVPLMLLSGLWMWKGHVLRRFNSKGLAKQEAAAKLIA